MEDLAFEVVLRDRLDLRDLFVEQVTALRVRARLRGEQIGCVGVAVPRQQIREQGDVRMGE